MAGEKQIVCFAHCIWTLLLSLRPWVRFLWSLHIHLHFWNFICLVTSMDSVCCYNCCFIFVSIYPGVHFRLQLMIMKKLPRAWWKLFSFEKSIHVLPTIASQEQHLSICVACKMKNGRLKMKCIQVNILVLLF